eukprot:5430607-Prymnesium_polylepis.1
MLRPFLKRVPIDEETQLRVTANPLMLSMVASIFELRKDVGMPKTITELYEVASNAMLKRGGVVSTALRKLLQVLFFEAHVAQKRVITDVQLYRAALGASAPRTLAELDRQFAERCATPPLPYFEGPIQENHHVEVRNGQWKGLRGILKDVDRWRPNPFRVERDRGGLTDWLSKGDVRSLGGDAVAARLQVLGSAGGFLEGQPRHLRS